MMKNEKDPVKFETINLNNRKDTEQIGILFESIQANRGTLARILSPESILHIEKMILCIHLSFLSHAVACGFKLENSKESSEKLLLSHKQDIDDFINYGNKLFNEITMKEKEIVSH